MSAVLGAARARQLLTQLRAELLLELRTPQDLYTLAQRMAGMESFEGAVGSMLSVAAVMRGATPSKFTRRA